MVRANATAGVSLGCAGVRYPAAMTAAAGRVWQHGWTAATLAALLLLRPEDVAAQSFARGVIIDEVTLRRRSERRPTPSTCRRTTRRIAPWNLLLAFHPGGARPGPLVEPTRAAAERYGYVVAASTTSQQRIVGRVGERRCGRCPGCRADASLSTPDAST